MDSPCHLETGSLPRFRDGNTRLKLGWKLIQVLELQLQLSRAWRWRLLITLPDFEALVNDTASEGLKFVEVELNNTEEVRWPRLVLVPKRHVELVSWIRNHPVPSVSGDEWDRGALQDEFFIPFVLWSRLDARHSSRWGDPLALSDLEFHKGVRVALGGLPQIRGAYNCALRHAAVDLKHTCYSNIGPEAHQVGGRQRAGPRRVFEWLKAQ